MLRWVADDKVLIALKSFSADQPSGRTGNGRVACVEAIVLYGMLGVCIQSQLRESILILICGTFAPSKRR